MAAVVVASSHRLPAGVGQRLSEARRLGVPGGRIAGTASTRVIANSENATTRVARTPPASTCRAALDELAALIHGALHGTPRVVSASVGAIRDDRGQCFLWQRSLVLGDWRLRSPAQ